MECLGGYTFHVMSSVILSGGVKIRDEHTMLRGVYISRHVFGHTFSWFENLGRAYNAEGGIHFTSCLCHTFRLYVNERRAWNALGVIHFLS